MRRSSAQRPSLRVRVSEHIPELPAETVELELIRTGVQALVKTLGPRKADRFLREWASILASEEVVTRLLPSRSLEEIRGHVLARRGAMAWLRQNLRMLLASIPPE